jgi:hypothetical protein
VGDEAREAKRAARSTARHERRRALATENLDAVPAGEAATPQERGFAACPCPKDCALHGDCLLCVAYHLRRGDPPRCAR